MRFYEFASADDKLELWNVIEKSVLQALDQQAPTQKSRNSANKSKSRTPTKGEFRRRGTAIAAANARNDVDPTAKAAEQLQQAQQFQNLQQQQIQQQLKYQEDWLNHLGQTASYTDNRNLEQS